MTRDNQQTDGPNSPDDSETNARPWLTRRSTLALGGSALGAAALGSGSMFAQEDGTETPTPGVGDETESDAAEDGHFLADLVDPVFGYPLDSGETDDVELDHVVDVTVQEGSGDHEDFPQEPDEEVPGEMLEVPAEFLFDPVGLHVEPDDLVHFDTIAGLHTVTAFHEKFQEPGLDMPTRVPDGVAGFTSPPLASGESWVYQFTETGVYDYFCFPHLGLGMVGRIVVLDPEEDDVESDEFAAPTAGDLFPNDERVLSADELDPANIVDEGSVAWADLSLSDQSTPTPTETETTPGTETVTETESATETED